MRKRCAEKPISRTSSDAPAIAPLPRTPDSCVIAKRVAITYATYRTLVCTSETMVSCRLSEMITPVLAPSGSTCLASYRRTKRSAMRLERRETIQASAKASATYTTSRHGSEMNSRSTTLTPPGYPAGQPAALAHSHAGGQTVWRPP